jgi:hypothetical protein
VALPPPQSGAGLTQALYARRERACDLFGGAMTHQAVSKFVKNCRCCRVRASEAFTALIAVANQADSRLTTFLVLRSLRHQGFTGVQRLYNFLSKPTPLRGAA